MNKPKDFWVYIDNEEIRVVEASLFEQLQAQYHQLAKEYNDLKKQHDALLKSHMENYYPGD